MQEFLKRNEFTKAIQEINANTSTPASFSKRFFLWFDAFKLLKYLNFSHENFFQKKPAVEEAQRLLKLLLIEPTTAINSREVLQIYRQLDKKELRVFLS